MKEELKQAINALSTQIMDNRAMLYQARANIEENRLMVLSNYAAASSGNQQLAIHNTDDIFKSRKTILDSYDCETEEQARYVDAAKDRSELDLLIHSAELNRRSMLLNQKMVAINAQLIEANREVMELNQEMLEFNEENLDTNQELISGVLNPLLADAATIEELSQENDESVSELELLVDSNRKRVLDLLSQSKENRKMTISDKQAIGERKESLYANRDQITLMRNTIGMKVDYADLFLDGAED